MESNKLGKKIQDWAANLGFTLPDGSAPPANHFALLTATPHRRQLWETLVESVQSKQKVEHMRKQILVAKLQEAKKYNKTSSTLKPVTDRFDLWHKQNAYEAGVKEKRNAVINLERVIMTKTSDSLFEVGKLSELEKMLEEHMEKSVVLKFLMKRKIKIMEDFDRRLLRVKTDSDDYLKNSGAEGDSHCMEKRILNMEDCNCLLYDSHSCELLGKIEGTGVEQWHLWEEVIRNKRTLIEAFSKFLVDMNSSEKSLLSEKEKEIEKVLQASITQLKQKTTEKSLQMIVNSAKGKLLDGEIERLEESLLQEVGRPPNESTLNESFSFLVSGDLNRPDDETEKELRSVKNYLNMLELQKYEEFLKSEVKVAEEETMKSLKKDEWKESSEEEESLQLVLKAFDDVVAEINALESEEEKWEEGILREDAKLQALLRSLKGDVQGGARARGVEEAAEGVKGASEKQVDLLLGTSLDLFRTLESSSGGILFDDSQYLTSYGGELKQFFGAMLLPPAGDVRQVLSEVRRRKELLGEIRKVASEREKLAALQRRIQHELSSIEHDAGFCEKNFKESDAILWNVSCKTEELLREADHVEKILNNWVEQPYRSMIKETAWGHSLKEAEEKYAKAKNE